MAKLENAPIMLIIMDGWGIGDPNSKTNAVAVGKTPVIDALFAENPKTELLASGGVFIDEEGMRKIDTAIVL